MFRHSSVALLDRHRASCCFNLLVSSILNFIYAIGLIFGKTSLLCWPASASSLVAPPCPGCSCTPWLHLLLWPSFCTPMPSLRFRERFGAHCSEAGRLEGPRGAEVPVRQWPPAAARSARHRPGYPRPGRFAGPQGRIPAARGPAGANPAFAGRPSRGAHQEKIRKFLTGAVSCFRGALWPCAAAFAPARATPRRPWRWTRSPGCWCCC